MSAFEEAFKTKAQDTEADRARLIKIVEAQQKRGTSIIDVTRARNLCKKQSCYKKVISLYSVFRMLYKFRFGSRDENYVILRHFVFSNNFTKNWQIDR